ncbi:MAG: cytochrome c biogenesis protein ResB [Desulfomonilaceae bacterium]
MKKSKTMETGSSESVSILFQIKAFFTSVRTTVFLLFTIALGAVLGTVVPQGEPLEHIAMSGNTFLYRLAIIIDLNNIFRSWWFTTLLGLLTLNILGCLFQRLPGIWQDLRGRNPKTSFKLAFKSSLTAGELKDRLVSVGQEIMGAAPLASETKNGGRYSWVKGRIYLIGFPLIHIGIIVILLGSMIGAFWGYKGHMMISEGDSSNKFSLIPSGDDRTLPFTITVDGFKLVKYPTGEPKEFRSNVRLTENGKDIMTGSILVNHPLTYEGISLFQADYKILGVKDIKLSFKTKEGEKQVKTVDPRQEIDIPGTDLKLKTRSLDPGTIAQGPGIQVSIPGKPGKPKVVSIYQKDKEPLNVDGVEIRFLGFTPLYATGLQIGYDPGVRIVWLGCTMLVLGFALTLFTNLQKLSIEVTKAPKGADIAISGRSRKLRKEFRQKVEGAFAAVAELRRET